MFLIQKLKLGKMCVTFYSIKFVSILVNSSRLSWARLTFRIYFSLLLLIWFSVWGLRWVHNSRICHKAKAEKSILIVVFEQKMVFWNSVLLPPLESCIFLPHIPKMHAWYPISAGKVLESVRIWISILGLSLLSSKLWFTINHTLEIPRV